MITHNYLKNLLNNKDYEYPIEVDGIIDIFNVNKEYNNKLNNYGENYFHYNTTINLIPLSDDIGTKYYVSLAQLNFYKWFIEEIYYHINL